MSNRKLIGILLLVLPWVTLILTLSLYSMSSFIISQLNGTELNSSTWSEQTSLSIPAAHAAPLTGDELFQSSVGQGEPEQFDDDSLSSTAGRMLQVVLGLLGVLSLLGIFIGTPVGAYLIATSSSEESAHHAGQAKSLQGLSKAFMVFAGTTVVMSAIGAVLNVYEFARLKTTPFDLTLLTDPSPVSPVTMVGSAVGGLAGLAFIISAIIYLFWLGRAARNLSYHHHLKSSPEWLVWGHIIPVYNLIHPILTYPAFWSEVAAAHHAPEEEKAKGHKVIIAFYIFDLLMDVGNSGLPRLNDALGLSVYSQIYLLNSLHQALTVGAGIFIMLFVKMVTDKMEPQH